MRFVSWITMFLAIVAMTLVVGWLEAEYSWHAAVAPSIAVIYVIMLAVTLKPRYPKKVVKKP